MFSKITSTTVSASRYENHTFMFFASLVGAFIEFYMRIELLKQILMNESKTQYVVC